MLQKSELLMTYVELPMGDTECWSLGLCEWVRETLWVSIVNKYKKYLGVRLAYDFKYENAW